MKLISIGCQECKRKRNPNYGGISEKNEEPIEISGTTKDYHKCEAAFVVKSCVQLQTRFRSLERRYQT
jgi:hypothetical protein